jgi:hypothetical protein
MTPVAVFLSLVGTVGLVFLVRSLQRSPKTKNVFDMTERTGKADTIISDIRDKEKTLNRREEDLFDKQESSDKELDEIQSYHE